MTNNATDNGALFGLDDDHTAQLLARRLAAQPGAPVTALFTDEEVAALWAGQPGVRALVWEPTLVRDVLAAFPPEPVERLAPPPIVLGDLPIARRLVQEMAFGWAEAGGTLTVHCLGGCDEWAREASAVKQVAATWVQVPLEPRPVVEAVTELMARWQPPKPKRGTLTGPTVYVAASPEGRALAVARAVADEVPGARVVALLSGDIAWPTPDSVTVFTGAQARARALAGGEEPDQRLARLLFDDAAWLSAPDAQATAPAEPLFPPISHDPAGGADWERQDERVRSAFTIVAEACGELLAAGGVAARLGVGWSEPVVWSPQELAAVADGLLGLLGVARTPGTLLSALEVAARLPVLAARAGWRLRRAGGGQLLSAELVELLAPQVHLAYQSADAATGNATGSPLAAELWDGLTEFERASNRAVVVGCAVAHAAAGLGWRPRSAAGGVDIADQLGLLAELEHRRWAINERRHGRADHEWAKPWAQLSEDLRSYDERIMAAIPAILADAGLELYPLDATG